jgi:tetratricopeptide (TPR) repeat protein/tRNA A-37 threonylcarbamoyl transferase component Bud32
MNNLSPKTICQTCGSSLDLEMVSGFCPGCLLDTVLEAPPVRAAGSRIEDYELLNEIARGGMGIVYRARQHTPSRIVALKMILPAHLNSLGAVRRFRAEAEAAASLDHEGILPIYAVGEHDGAPFYSMKFAEGGTLAAHLADYENKPREAAVLIAKITRAIAFAHEHGILHRDLKPGNVLFDSAGKPHVSDFGLAKWVQRECDLTQTLAVLGTPFYMAPEQGRDSKAVTAAADIYSLGAILFHLLEGRPPIEGETPVEVLHRASAQTPRLTSRRAPRDLETICLKCLEKEPGARYESAAALADDLERFCADRPIRARPLGLTSRGWRWTRRNPMVAPLAICLLALLLVLVAQIPQGKKKPTPNAEAYALYTKASATMRQPAAEPAPLEEAQHLFERAIALDPQFALAHARLSRVHSLLYAYFSPEAVHKEQAKAEAEKALRLEPKLGDGHLALATYLSRIERNYDLALKEFDIAQAALPNDPYVYHGRGHALMRRGKFPEAIADFERATALDPMNWNLADALANAYLAVRMFSAAEHAKKRAFELVDPKLVLPRWVEEESWGWAYYYLTNSFQKLDDLLSRPPLSREVDRNGLTIPMRFFDRLIERRYAEAEREIASFPAAIFDIWSGARVTKSFLLGTVAIAQGDAEKARPFFEAEAQFAEQELREMPDSPTRQAQLGIVYAYLGRKTEAIAAGKRAVELMPLSRDAYDGPMYLVSLAGIYAWVGEREKAIGIIEQLLTIPNGMAKQELQLWTWDPLRADPNFQKLLARR